MLRTIVRSVLGNAVTAAILIAISGHADWFRGWAYVGSITVMHLAVILLIYRPNPDLMRERSRIQKGTKRWDKFIVAGAAIVAPLVMVVLAGLDVRRHWPPPVPLWVSLIAFAICVPGELIVFYSMRANRFFSTTVRIQSDRGHKVVDFGPYRRIRHPGYAGMILFNLFGPLALGSWWALIPSSISAALFILRAALEDRTLHAELPGYREYAARVSFRLLPGIW